MRISSQILSFTVLGLLSVTSLAGLVQPPSDVTPRSFDTTKKDLFTRAGVSKSPPPPSKGPSKGPSKAPSNGPAPSKGDVFAACRRSTPKSFPKAHKRTQPLRAFTQVGMQQKAFEDYSRPFRVGTIGLCGCLGVVVACTGGALMAHYSLLKLLSEQNFFQSFQT